MKTLTQEQVRRRLLKRNKEIIAGNERFNAASPAQQRIMVAEDVKLRVLSGQYYAQSGIYVGLEIESEGREKESVQNLLLEEEIDCSCCGIGAVMLSGVALKNRITVKDYYNGHLACGTDMRSDRDKTGMLKLFGKRQLSLIEAAFEIGITGSTRNDIGRKDTFTRDEFDRAVNFGWNYCDPTERLLAIMDNIINNNGTFIP